MKVLRRFFRNTESVYTRKQNSGYLLVAVSVLIISIIAVLYLHPGIRPRWDSRYRQQILTSFELQLSQNTIDPQAYWVFRERYSPGTFQINPSAVGIYQTFRITNLSESVTPLLEYDSTYLISTDAIVSAASISAFVPENIEPVINLQQQKLWKDDQNNTHLVFLLPVSEMKKANGFFDYLPSETVLLTDKYWLNHTVIKTD